MGRTDYSTKSMCAGTEAGGWGQAKFWSFSFSEIQLTICNFLTLPNSSQTPVSWLSSDPEEWVEILLLTDKRESREVRFCE